MRGLIAEDQVQFDRIERTIATIMARPAAEQARMGVLLAALQKEKTHILNCGRRTPQRPRTIQRPRPIAYAAL